MISEKPTLLIVEDDDNDFVFLERALVMEKFEARVQRVCDGVEAIEYLSGENAFANRDKHPLPSFIVLDLKLSARTIETYRVRLKRKLKARNVAELLNHARKRQLV